MVDFKKKYLKYKLKYKNLNNVKNNLQIGGHNHLYLTKYGEHVVLASTYIQNLDEILGDAEYNNAIGATASAEGLFSYGHDYDCGAGSLWPIRLITSDLSSICYEITDNKTGLYDNQVIDLIEYSTGIQTETINYDLSSSETFYFKILNNLPSIYSFPADSDMRNGYLIFLKFETRDNSSTTNSHYINVGRDSNNDLVIVDRQRRAYKTFENNKKIHRGREEINFYMSKATDYRDGRKDTKKVTIYKIKDSSLKNIKYKEDGHITQLTKDIPHCETNYASNIFGTAPSLSIIPHSETEISTQSTLVLLNPPVMRSTESVQSLYEKMKDQHQFINGVHRFSNTNLTLDEINEELRVINSILQKYISVGKMFIEAPDNLIILENKKYEILLQHSDHRHKQINLRMGISDDL